MAKKTWTYFLIRLEMFRQLQIKREKVRKQNTAHNIKTKAVTIRLLDFLSSRLPIDGQNGAENKINFLPLLMFTKKPWKVGNIGRKLNNYTSWLHIYLNIKCLPTIASITVAIWVFQQLPFQALLLAALIRFLSALLVVLAFLLTLHSVWQPYPEGSHKEHALFEKVHGRCPKR